MSSRLFDLTYRGTKNFCQINGGKLFWEISSLDLRGSHWVVCDKHPAVHTLVPVDTSSQYLDSLIDDVLKRACDALLRCSGCLGERLATEQNEYKKTRFPEGAEL